MLQLLLNSVGPSTLSLPLKLHQPPGSTPLPCWPNVVVGEGDGVDGLGVARHSERRAHICRGGEVEEAGEGVGHHVAHASRS